MLVVLTVVLLAAIAAGVAAVAGGVGGSMSPAQPDLADPGLPARPVRPDDVAGVRLQVALRGYRMDQVDEVLDRLQAELADRDEVLAQAACAGVLPGPLRERAARWLPEPVPEPAEPAADPSAAVREPFAAPPAPQRSVSAPIEDEQPWQS